MRCRLDHLFMSRGEDDLKKRVIYLVQCIEKELEEGHNSMNQTKQRQIENDNIDDESVKIDLSRDNENDPNMDAEADKKSQSQESGIRIGDGMSDAAYNKDRHRAKHGKGKFDSQSKLDMNESQELDEIMNQEMIKDQLNQDSAVKMDSNGGNMTTDLETNNERPSFISMKPVQTKKQPKLKEVHQKNGRNQQDIGNWLL